MYRAGGTSRPDTVEAKSEAALKIYEELDAQADIDLSAENNHWPSFDQLYIPLR
jgi:hypothetical protein